MELHDYNVNEFLKSRKITPYLMWLFIKDVSNALRKIHKQNISHRDLKPANVVVGRYDIFILLQLIMLDVSPYKTTPTFKLIDFDLSKS